MTQLAFDFKFGRRQYHRFYYHINARRRRAQRLASKYGCAKEFRLWLN
jgi:hypothetical protein